eukprot:Sspe_Gene.57210::Locus_31405_Transcript_1_1_Confidence_1.000_Length_951::g.57210::m.57210
MLPPVAVVLLAVCWVVHGAPAATVARGDGLWVRRTAVESPGPFGGGPLPDALVLELEILCTTQFVGITFDGVWVAVDTNSRVRMQLATSVSTTMSISRSSGDWRSGSGTSFLCPPATTATLRLFSVDSAFRFMSINLEGAEYLLNGAAILSAEAMPVRTPWRLVTFMEVAGDYLSGRQCATDPVCHGELKFNITCTGANISFRIIYLAPNVKGSNVGKLFVRVDSSSWQPWDLPRNLDWGESPPFRAVASNSKTVISIASPSPGMRIKDIMVDSPCEVDSPATKPPTLTPSVIPHTTPTLPLSAPS